MQTIQVKYIDTTKYTVTINQDNDIDGPNTWGNFEIVQFRDRDFGTYKNIDNYCTENGKSLPGIQVKIKAGKIFTFTYNRYSSCDGGYYRYPSNETDPDNIDGFIIFDNDYIKGVSYSDRKRYATGDLKEYTDWANGEVYGVTITDNTGHEIDNCSGFIGDYAVKQFIADCLPNAINDNVTITGQYDDGSTYNVYFDYNDCIKLSNEGVTR